MRKHETMAQIILRRRAAAGLSQKECARRASLSVKKLAAYEHGHTVPGYVGISVLAAVLGGGAAEMHAAYDRQFPGWRSVVRQLETRARKLAGGAPT